jgi:predicted transcriptional regulator
MADNLLTLTTKVVSAYVANNNVVANQVADIINGVYAAIKQLGSSELIESQTALVPAVSVRKSVQPEHITCLECGRKLKMLKRHINTDHGLTVDEYRAKWGLASDYPVVAPKYAELRSELAKKTGLGLGRKG